MHTFRCGYRFADNRVEGFTGFGFGEQGAKEDCLEQVRRKLSGIPGEPQAVDHSGLIFSEDDLTAEELESVRRDWARSRRYGPNGNLYP